MNKRKLIFTSVFLFVFLNIACVSMAANKSNVTLEQLQSKIETLEKENQSLKKQIDELDKDKIIQLYKEENERLCQSTDKDISRMTIITSIILGGAALIVTILTGFGAISPIKTEGKLKKLDSKLDSLQGQVACELEKAEKSAEEAKTISEKVKILAQEAKNSGDEAKELAKEAKAAVDQAKESENKAKASKYFNQAYKYYEEKDYKKALEYYNKAKALDPNDPGIYNNIGKIYEKQNEYEEALKNYNKAKELDPNDAVVYRNIGNVYKYHGKYKEVLKNYNKAKELDLNNAGDYNNIADTYTNMGEWNLAENEIAAALQIDDKNGVLYITKAEICIGKGDEKGFYENIEQALKNGLLVSEIEKDKIYDKYKEDYRFMKILNKYRKNGFSEQ